MALPIDITDQLRAKGAELNEEDRVYSVDGYTIKVKTWHDDTASDHGREVFRVSGSECDEMGKALRRADGKPAVYSMGRHLVVQAESPANLTVDIERLRFGCVNDTITAAKHHRDARNLTGVGYRKLHQLTLEEPSGLA